MTQPPGPLPGGRGIRSLASSDAFSVADAIGGPRGVTETVLPGLAFVVVFTVVRELSPAVWSAVGLAVLLALVRLIQRQNPQQAISGLLGVAVCAWWSRHTGKAEDFYAPGLWINIGYASAYVVSIVLRWPLLGVLIGPLLGEGTAWRSHPARLRAYQRASWLWVAMFLLRLAVQWPLYLAHLVGPLGVARLAMGVPLFALTAYLSWLVLRATHPVRPATPADGESTSGPAGEDVSRRRMDEPAPRQR